MLEDLDCCWNCDDDGCFLENVGRQIADAEAAAADDGRQVAAVADGKGWEVGSGDCREEGVVDMVGMG